MKQPSAKARGRPFLILLGSFLFAASLSLFLTPASIVTGGVSGVAILLAEFIPIGVGALFLLLNLPVLLAGFWKFGKGFMLSTLFATLLSSFFTDLLDVICAPFLPLTDNLLLAALGGGALCGAGLGLVFRADATTGGTDIGVRLLRLRFPRIKPSILFFLIDFTVVLACALVFSAFRAAVYSTIALITTSVAIECVLYRGRN